MHNRAYIYSALTLWLILTILAVGCKKSADDEGDLSSLAVAESLSDASKDMPATIKETNLFIESNPNSPVAALSRYEIRVPFWSDGAEKTRFAFVPANEKITLRKNGDGFDFPNGVSFVKHFKSGDTNIETRVITKKSDGSWHYASYIWESDGSTKLNTRPVTIQRDGRDFRIPSESECKQCHSESQPILGFVPNQLKIAEDKDTFVFNTMRTSGRLQASDEDVAAIKSLADPKDEGLSIKERTRSYLQVNCSACHNPSGLPEANKLDLRLEATDTGLFRNTKVIPGDAESSILWKKVSGDQDRMPTLSIRQDPLALELIKKYIENWQE